MRAADTNIVVRVVVQDDPAQYAAAEKFIESGAWVSVLVLAEAVWVLSTVYRLPSNEIATAVSLLLNHEHLVIEDAHVVAAAVEVFRSKPSLRFSDCLILELARAAGHLPLGTFDRALAKVDGAVRVAAA